MIKAIMIKLFYQEIVTSTQDVAKDMLFDLIQNPVIVADKQTHGRGRSGKKWASLEMGNLYMSVGIQELTNKLLQQTQSIVPIIIAVCVARALNLYQINDFKFKWPNDLLINGKKVGGIMIEMHGKKLVIGIGVNVMFTPQVEDVPTTCLVSEGYNVELTMVKMATKIGEEIVKTLQQNQTITQWNEQVLNQWRSFCWKKPLDEINVKHGTRFAYSGIFKGLSSDGKISIEMDGKNIEISYGDITF